MPGGEIARIHDAMPQYKRVKAHISALISEGELKPGERVPSELELVRTFAISRMTVSRALNELAKEGMITRIQGVGSFVTKNKSESALMQIRGIADEVTEAGQSYSCVPLRIERSRSKRINRLLGLGDDQSHYRTILQHNADGIPIQIEDRRVNPGFAPDYIDQDFTAITPHRYLMSVGPLQAAEHVFEAALPSAKEADWLKIDTGAPCIVLRRRTWSLNMVASFAIITSPSDQRRYSGRFGTLPPVAGKLPKI